MTDLLNRSYNKFTYDIKYLTLEHNSDNQYSLYIKSRSKRKTSLSKESDIPERKYSIKDFYIISSKVNKFKVYILTNEFEENRYEVYGMYEYTPEILSLSRMKYTRDNNTIGKIISFIRQV